MPKRARTTRRQAKRHFHFVIPKNARVSEFKIPHHAENKGEVPTREYLVWDRVKVPDAAKFAKQPVEQ